MKEVIIMKTKEELTAVKEEAEAKNEKVLKLNDEELNRCVGGKVFLPPPAAGGVVVSASPRFDGI